ncbi:MAG: NAD+ synthase [Alphaproteobacteria bacterium]|nr:NAD+ synthase [Alphaproteobacteria bacterium]
MSQTLRIALAQLNVTVGDIEGNATRIIQAARDADAQGADLLLTPEMVLTGYPPEDLILMPAFRAACRAQVEAITMATKDLRCALILGTLWEEQGRIYNASVLVEAGKTTRIRLKHDLPNYGVFDEKRVFAVGAEPTVLSWRGHKLGVLICEEVWDTELPLLLAKQGAEILLVQNASPYHIGKAWQRSQVVSAASQATGLPVVYLNLVGGQDELVFDGRSYVHEPNRKDAVWLKAFEEHLGLVTFEKTAMGWQVVDGPKTADMSNAETIYKALVLGLRDYVTKNGFPSVVLGLSGGIDSGLSAAIAVDALGADKVIGIKLSSPFTSKDSVEDADALAKSLGIRCESVPITALMDAARLALKNLFSGRKDDTTEENIQARLRGLLLMAVSNKFGHMVLTTGNKSEMSVGYATLYGDMCGGFSVLKDVYKTTVFKLSRWRNTQNAVIPERMITKSPTAELRHNQKDEDSLPPYDVLDTILRGLIERRLAVAELVAEGLNEETVTRVARMVIGAEYKRRQSAPGVKVTPMAFGRDRRWPITNKWRFL